MCMCVRVCLCLSVCMCAYHRVCVCFFVSCCASMFVFVCAFIAFEHSEAAQKDERCRDLEERVTTLNNKMKGVSLIPTSVTRL